VLPHAVASVSGSPGPSLSMAYDCNGNMVAAGTETYSFDAENRIKTRSVSGGPVPVTYLYDGTGAEVKRTNADFTSTVYVEGIYEKDLLTGTIRKYYHAFGRPVAFRVIPGGAGSGSVYYPLADHLGSTATILSQQGWYYADMSYWPYGATRAGSISVTDRKYTGQREETGDSALGLYNYNARFYSTTLGRFVSADPVTEGGLNRYAYVRSNPLAYRDPSGFCSSAFGMDDECSPERANDILDCALAGKCGGSDPSAALRLSLAIIQGDEFWSNFWVTAVGGIHFELFYDAITSFESMTMPQLNLISVTGWDVLGRFWGVSGYFLKLSLFDLANGTEFALQDASSLIGAKPWWRFGPERGGHGFTLSIILANQFGVSAGEMGKRLARYETRILEASWGLAYLIDQGYAAGNGIDYPAFPVDAYNWSNWQRSHVVLGADFDVDPARLSSYETPIGGCGKGVECVRLFRIPYVPPIIPYPY
jgi:RHS repeat-associated protein